MTRSEPESSVAWDGVVEPFEQFYAREFPRLVPVARALSGSRMGAEDLVQEAMIAVHRDWDRVGRLDRPGAWARRVVLNLASSAYHRRRAEVRALLRLAPLRGGQPAVLAGDAAMFWDAVRRLPTRQAQAVTLFYLDDLSVAECAEVMEIAEGTVKALLHQGRQRLAAEFGEDE